MPLSKGTKAGIIIASGATIAGSIAYLLYQSTTAGGTVTACEQQYANIMLLYNSTYQQYVAEDNKAGIALTATQQANLNSIYESAQAQLQQCASIAKSANDGIAIIEDDIGEGILLFLSIQGILAAYNVLKQTGRKPKRPDNKPPTPAQELAFMYPIIIQYMLDKGLISADMAPTYSDYVNNTVTPYLQQQNTYMYQYYLQQNFIDDALYATLVAASATYITETMAIAIAILA